MAQSKSNAVVNPLAKFANLIKSADRANQSPADALRKIIDDYTATEQFDRYISLHAADVAKYLKPDDSTRLGRWRASAAGKCMQAQAFNVAQKLKPGRFEQSALPTPRKTDTLRALANGTFTHIRWHLLFDALEELGSVKTLHAEDLRYFEAAQLSGTVDRVIEFDWNGRTIRAILDFKSMKSSSFDPMLEPKADHVLQLSSYALFDYRATHYVLLYENKDTHVLKIFARCFDEHQVAKVLDNCRKLNNWIDLLLVGAINDQLPFLPLDTQWCRWCEWNVACLKLNPDRDSQHATK